MELLVFVQQQGGRDLELGCMRMLCVSLDNF